jgi:hypothetical protein
MEPILEFLLANDMKELEGLKISGTIPVSETLVNKVLADYVAQLKNGPVKAPSAKAAAARAAPKRDYAALLRQLEVRTLNVRFEAGKMVLNIDLGR